MEHIEELKEKYTKYIEKNPDDACWGWKASKNNRGYGIISHNKSTYMVHRVSWMIHNGKIPEDLLVLHRCDNPPCSNPNHLFLGTHRDNMQDMIKKGRNRIGSRHGNRDLKDTNNKPRKQMAFDINPEIHMKIKVLAAQRNISINLWMMRAIIDRIKKETREE